MKGKRRREIVHAGQVHDTTVPHPDNHPGKRVGIDGREKRLGGGSSLNYLTPKSLKTFIL